ncbi:MAG: SGNH/GDSL hydrolase family protein [Eubacteriales bacterium]|nr:SGNH/GDSL hydrolase family protein [Eubacteriales bacterium]
MKTYSFTEAPIEICGLEVIDAENRNYWRLPDEETMPVSEYVRSRSKTAGGGRVRFRTNSRSLTLRMELHSLGVDPCMAVCASGGADVLLGSGIESHYAGLINPWTYENMAPELKLQLDGTMQQVTINLPRNERIAGVWITVEDDAEVLAPLPYSRPGRLCFYGSSITEGGCCSRPGNAYTAVAARWLDTDYVNYGFSGNAKGEDAMADIICRREFSAFIYDYDHNAPDAAHLAATHERFFLRVRAAHPELPVVIMTKPDFDSHPADATARREVIRRTYANAVARGDRNVYFLDGEGFFGALGRDMCTVDGCHPNDLGFYRMAEQVYALLSRIL